MRKIMALIVGMGLASAVAVQTRAADDELKNKDFKVLDQAPEILQALTSAPDKGIPRHLLERAECIVVFPNVTKGAFVIGGEFGRGIATCRHEDGKMGAPALFTLGGGSVGWQFGGESTDLVLLVMDRNGMDNLLRNEFKIGGEASVAAGPVGRTAEASTDVGLGAQMLSWSRTEGIFAGASLEGSVMKPNKAANERLYGRPISAEQIFQGNLTVPMEARRFVEIANNVASDTEATAQTDYDYDRPSTSTSGNRTVTDTQTQRQLPRTASPLALYGITGVFSLLAAYGMRFRSRRR